MRNAAVTASVLVVALLVWMMTLPAARSAVRYVRWLLPGNAETVAGYVDAGDAAIYYRSTGHGPTVVLLHGGATSIEAFFAQIPELSQRFELVAIDLRGQGRSSRGTAPLSYALLADDVAVVLERLAVAPVAVVGWSDGGVAALMLALRHPPLVSRLALISTNFHHDGLDGGVGEEAPGLWSHLMYRLLSPAPEAWPRLVSELKTLWGTQPRLEPCRLSRIAVPTLVMVGEHDAVDIEHTASLQTGIPGAILAVIPGASHRLLWEAPQEVNRRLDEFLAPLRAGTARSTLPAATPLGL